MKINVVTNNDNYSQGSSRVNYSCSVMIQYNLVKINSKYYKQ